MRTLLLLLPLGACALADLAGNEHRIEPLDWDSCEAVCGALSPDVEGLLPARDTCVSWCFYAEVDPTCGEEWEVVAGCRAARHMGIPCTESELNEEQLQLGEWDRLEQACTGAPPRRWDELFDEATP